jgi:hypothetical protein
LHSGGFGDAGTLDGKFVRGRIGFPDWGNIALVPDGKIAVAFEDVFEGVG